MLAILDSLGLLVDAFFCSRFFVAAAPLLAALLASLQPAPFRAVALATPALAFLAPSLLGVQIDRATSSITAASVSRYAGAPRRYMIRQGVQVSHRPESAATSTVPGLVGVARGDDLPLRITIGTIGPFAAMAMEGPL